MSRYGQKVRAWLCHERAPMTPAAHVVRSRHLPGTARYPLLGDTV
jgi:hypothetical protein